MQTKLPDPAKRLATIAQLLEKKRQDYSPGQNRFTNFEFSNALASNYPTQHKAFAVLVGVKLSRIAELLNSTELPRNESIADSFDDLIGYCALWAEYTNELLADRAFAKGGNQE